MGNTLMGCLCNNGYEATTLESYGKIFDIVEELARRKYAMVIATNTSLSPSQIQYVVPAIKAQFPDARIIVLSGFYSTDFVSDLKQKGVDGCLPLPFEEVVLMNKVDELLSAPIPIRESI